MKLIGTRSSDITVNFAEASQRLAEVLVERFHVVVDECGCHARAVYSAVAPESFTTLAQRVSSDRR